MTRTAVAVRHVPFENLGILAPMLAERGYDIRYLDAGVETIDDAALVAAELLVVLGGPIGVGDVDTFPFVLDETRAIAARIGHGRPILGVCLGAQLIASALGAPVTPTGSFEIGYAPLTLTPEGGDSVLAPLADEVVLHWHGDQFAIPDGAVRLAQTPGCPNQAFSYGGHALALQFHIEADHNQIERWLIGHAHELATHEVDPRVIRADARRHGPGLAQRARAVLEAWLEDPASLAG